MNDTYEIKLIDYLCGNCPLEGCIYNDHGLCICEDEDFKLEIFEQVRNEFENNRIPLKAKFECNQAKSKENHCIYCGYPLTIVNESVPYGNTNVNMPIVECKHCGGM